MSFSFRMPREEWLFALLMASVHGGQHVFLRLFPPLIPILAVDLDAALWQLGLLVSVYLFAGGLFQAPMGVLSDRIDRMYLLVPAFVAMSIGYLVFVLAPVVGPTLVDVRFLGHVFTGPFLVMALGMFVAGFGYSAIHPVGYPLISSNVSAENKGKVLGMWGSASKLGDSVAPLLVGVLILVFAWKWILVGVSLFGFVYAAGLLAVLRTPRFETRPPALLGADAVDASDSNRAMDADRGTDDNRGPDDNPSTADPERFSEEYSTVQQFLVPMAVIMLFFFFVLFTGNGLQTYTPVFVADVYGYSLSIAGVDVAPESVANFYFATLLISGAISQLLVGSLTDAYDHRAVLMALLGLASVGLAALATLTLSPLLLAVVFVLIGACAFGINPARDALISDITPAEYEGRTFGYIWTLALVGSSGYPVIIGYLADTAGLRTSFGLLALGSLFGVACVGLLYSPRIYG